MKKLALHWKIIIGLVLGIVFGLLSRIVGINEFVLDWIKPVGTIFVNGLKLIAIPLVLASLIMGVASLRDFSKLSRIGTRTMGIYIFTTVIAVVIGLTFVNVLSPGDSFPEDLKQEIASQFGTSAASKIESAKMVGDRGPLQPLIDVVSTNIFSSVQDNRKMLQVVFFALVFGIALVSIPEEKSKPVIAFFDGLNEVVLKLVEFIMYMAPYAVFSLMAGLIAEFKGDVIELLKALLEYSGTVVLGLGTMIFIIYPLLLKLITKGKINLKDFFRGIMPAQLLAFSTSSSAATLPVTKDQCEKELGISENITSFVLPLGATINMDGTCLYQAVATVFIANVAGIPLDFGDQITIVATASLASIGSAAVPGAGMVMLVIVLQSVGIPVELIALIMAPDRILDMCRTVVNVTGDASVAYAIGTSEGEIKKP